MNLSNVRDATRLLEHVEQAMSRSISPGFGPAVRQLLAWTGEAAASTPGALPSDARTVLRTELGDDTDEAVLSKIERDALWPDEARRSLAEMTRRLAALVSASMSAALSLSPESPGPSSRGRWDSQAVGLVAWAVGVVRESGAHTVRVELLQAMAMNADRLAALVETYRPAPAKQRHPDLCHAHEQAGCEAFIDRRNYSRLHLCRWCGDFRTDYGINPPPKVVRHYEKHGRRPSPMLLRSMGVHQAPKRRPA